MGSKIFSFKKSAKVWSDCYLLKNAFQKQPSELFYVKGVFKVKQNSQEDWQSLF